MILEDLGRSFQDVPARVELSNFRTRSFIPLSVVTGLRVET